MPESLRRVGLAAALLVGVSLAGVLSGPAPAHAAAGNLEVSSDGTGYSKSYQGVLFDSLGAIVPGDEQTETFYLRNTGDEAGYLRVVLENVTFDDLDFANALTVQAVAGGASGSRTAISLAQPCRVVLEGTIVPAGESVRVDTLLELGNLDGTRGQGATASLAFTASLSDLTPGSVPPTTCAGPEASVPIQVTPPPAAAPSAPAVQPARVADASVPAQPVTPSGDLPVLNLPGGIVIDPNTWQLFEEYLVFVLLGATLAGGLVFALVKRRRSDGAAAGEPEGDGTK